MRIHPLISIHGYSLALILNCITQELLAHDSIYTGYEHSTVQLMGGQNKFEGHVEVCQMDSGRWSVIVIGMVRKHRSCADN